jgi:glutamate-1-semialdehyde 2,1-aminomutase
MNTTPEAPDVAQSRAKPSSLGLLIKSYEDALARALPQSVALKARGFASLAGGVSANVKLWYHIYVRDAKGSRFRDIDDNSYIDLCMGYGPNMLGHSPDFLIDAVASVIRSGTSLVIATPLEVQLAEKIQTCVPSMELMRFVVSGTEATMMALRAARAFTGKSKVAKFVGHYHGQHDLILFNGVGDHADAVTPVPDCAGLPDNLADNIIVLPWNDLDRSVELITQYADELAAVICEPVPFFQLGGNPPDPGFLQGLRDITSQTGVLLVFDEVITGFRLCLGGAAEYFSVIPDLHTFGKLIGGGFPIGVYGGRKDIMEKAVSLSPHGGERGKIFQSGTFSGAPPSMAAGLAMVSALESSEVYGTVGDRAEQLRAGWRSITGELGMAAQITGIESMFGIYFTDRPIRTLTDAATNDALVSRAFSLGLLAHGVYFKPAHPGVIAVTHTPDDIAEVLRVSRTVLEEIQAAG